MSNLIYFTELITSTLYIQKSVWQSKYRSHTAYGVDGFCFSFVQANSVQAEFLELKIMVLKLKKTFHQKYENFIKREWSRKSAKVPCRQSAFWQTEKAKPHTKFLLIRIYTLEIMQKRQFRSEYRQCIKLIFINTTLSKNLC